MGVDPTQTSAPKTANLDQLVNLLVRRERGVWHFLEGMQNEVPVFEVAASQFAGDKRMHQNPVIHQ